MPSFTEDTIERKTNAREKGTTTDTKEFEKASRYDEGRHALQRRPIALEWPKGLLVTLELPPKESQTHAYGNFFNHVCGPE
jgi:hypothetical protein